MLTEVIQEQPTDYSPPDYDGLWKKVISDLFEEFILFFAPDLYDEINFNKSPDYLQQELYKKVIQRKKGRNDADLIVKVTLNSGEDQWILIHIEVQDRDSSDFSKRMFRYFYRIYDKFDKEVYAIALMTDDKKSKVSDYFHYNFFGTTVDYTYNVYKFHDHTVEELEQSNNPFAIAIIAGKYAEKYKKDVDQRFYFKRKLMIQILKNYSQRKNKSRTYLIALFNFIDYLLQLPKEHEGKLDNELAKSNKKGDEKSMQAEKEILSPTLTRLLDTLKEQELAEVEEKGIEKGKSEGSKEAKINFAKKLIKEDFGNEKIAELTGLALPKVIEIRKTLQD